MYYVYVYSNIIYVFTIFLTIHLCTYVAVFYFHTEYIYIYISIYNIYTYLDDYLWQGNIYVVRWYVLLVHPERIAIL